MFELRPGRVNSLDCSSHYCSGQTIFNFTYIENVTLNADEAAEVAGGASGTRLDRIGEVGDKTSEG